MTIRLRRPRNPAPSATIAGVCASRARRWERTVQTGKFDRNPSAQQIHTLAESAGKLEIDTCADDKTAPAGSTADSTAGSTAGGFNPFQGSHCTRRR